MANNSTSFVIDSGSRHDFCFLSVLAFDPYNDTNRPHSFQTTWTVLATVNGLASPPTVILNALIIWTVFGNEDLRSSNFNFLLALLAGTDFLVGLMVQPMYCYFVGYFINGRYSPCYFTLYILLLVACCGITNSTLLIACAERYLAIEHPNIYLRMITRRRVLKVTAAIWMAVLVYSMVAIVFNPQLSKLPFTVAMGLSGLVILYCTFKAHLTAYRQARTIALQHDAVQYPQPDNQQLQEKRKTEHKKVFMMTVIVSISILFYTPFIAVALIEASRKVTRDFKYLAGPIAVTFIHLQSIINPVSMSLRLSYIRQGIKNKIACFTGN